MIPNAQNVFKEAWKMITKIQDSERYMACAEAWIYFIVKHFKVNYLIYMRYKVLINKIFIIYLLSNNLFIFFFYKYKILIKQIFCCRSIYIIHANV